MGYIKVHNTISPYVLEASCVGGGKVSPGVAYDVNGGVISPGLIGRVENGSVVTYTFPHGTAVIEIIWGKFVEGYPEY